MATSDLSGIFYIQQQYLADLSAISQAGDGTTGLTAMQDLRKQLNSIYSGYQSAYPSADAILTRQRDMQQIINKENARLDNKKMSVDSALFGQKRMAQFSDSYSKKYFAQIKILFIIIIVLVIYLGLTLLNNYIPVPDIIFYFIMIVIGGFAIYIISNTIRDINRRYNMDFDKINLTAPANSSAGGGLTGNIKGVGSPMVCIGEGCCPPGNPDGSIWNKNTQQCISFDKLAINKPDEFNKVFGNTKSGFTVMSQSNCMGSSPNIRVNGQVNPYEPSEISNYTRI